MPRQGETLVVAAVCRCSGAEDSGDDTEEQFRELQSYLTGVYSGPIEWIAIHSTQVGRLDDEQLDYLVSLIKSGRVDVLICSSLDRIGRCSIALGVLALCEGHGLRLIAAREPFDSVRFEKMYDFLDAMSSSLPLGRRRLKHFEDHCWSKLGVSLSLLTGAFSGTTRDVS